MKESEKLKLHIKNSQWLSDMDIQRYSSWANEFEKKESMSSDSEKTCFVIPNTCIMKVLSISTSHLEEEECKSLYNHSSYKCPEGFMICVEDEGHEYPSESDHFSHILKYARSAKFDYIMFDRDAEPLKCFQAFNW